MILVILLPHLGHVFVVFCFLTCLSFLSVMYFVYDLNNNDNNNSYYYYY